MKSFFKICLLTIAAVATAQADFILTLDNPDQTASPGDTVQYNGYFTNTGDDAVFLNSDNAFLTGPASLNFNDLFFANAPFSVDGHSTSDDVELFEITVADPFTDPFQQYSGSYPVLGGPDGNEFDPVASADFSITVQQSTSTTPEPASFLLLGTALAALGLRARRLRP